MAYGNIGVCAPLPEISQLPIIGRSVLNLEVTSKLLRQAANYRSRWLQPAEKTGFANSFEITSLDKVMGVQCGNVTC